MFEKHINPLDIVQGEEIEGMSFVNILGTHLRAIAEFSRSEDGGAILLKIRLFYDNDPVGMLPFSLHNYTEQECLELAQNIADNQFLLREIDEYLSGDGGE